VVAVPRRPGAVNKTGLALVPTQDAPELGGRPASQPRRDSADQGTEMRRRADLPTAIGDIQVRDGAPSDYAAIRRLLYAAYGPYRGMLPPTVFARWLADLQDLEQHAALGRIIVAETGGQVVASGAFYPDSTVQGFGWPPGWAGGRALAVHPSTRGVGVARAFIDICEALASDGGADVFAFHTAEFMTKAVALYERLGYCRAPDFDLDLNAHYGGPDDRRPITFIAYRRDLLSAAA
jgi:predicted N-acetyltransferase YhbS